MDLNDQIRDGVMDLYDVEPLTVSVPAIAELKAPAILADKSHVTFAEAVRGMLECEGRSPVRYAEGALWRYLPQVGVWSKLEDADERQAVHLINRKWMVVGRDENGKDTLKLIELMSGQINGVIKELHALAGVADERFFDSASAGLQFANGFLHLDERTLDLKGNSADWRQRLALSLPWTGPVQAPLFMQALTQWFEGDEDAEQKSSCLQEFAGACLFGLATRWQKCLVLKGEGSDGKSTFIKLLQDVFPPDSWSAINPQDFDKEYYKFRIANKRLNVASDIPSKDILNSSAFKELIAGDVTVARQINEAVVQFRPVAGHIFSANELPGTRDMTYAFWRRFLVLEFNNQFGGSKPPRPDRAARWRPQDNPGLAQQILKTEREGLISWLVEGAQRALRQEGYTVPPSSVALVERWRKLADVVALWVEERCDTPDRPEDGLLAKDAFEDFNRWRRANEYSALGSRTFYGRLKGLYGEPIHTRNGNRYPLALRNPQPDFDAPL